MSEQFIYSQKNNFSGGELTPTIEGRNELGLYQNGAKKLTNFIILPSGGIMRRHGTSFVHKFNNHTSRASSIVRKIISVMFSRELSYLLVFECINNKTTCSFFVNGDLFVTTKEIKDEGSDFTFKLKNFSYCCFQGIAYISFGIDKPIFKFSIDPAVVERFYSYIEQQRLEPRRTATAARRRQNVNNITILSDEHRIELDNRIVRQFHGQEEMFIIEPLKAHIAYYKQMQGDIPLQRPFNEVIYNADIDKINDVLKGLHAAGDTNIYEKKEEKLYASTLVTFENRLWCFGVNKNIHLIWASYKGDFYDFRMSYKTLLEARNPLTAVSSTFSSETFDNVLWTVPFSTEMLLGTTDGIYLIKEGDRSKGEFIKIHKELDVPVSPIKPVIIGKTIFFVEGSNRKINSLYYSQEKGGFQISDITAYSEHIFNTEIKQIVGINSPFSMIFAVLKDGNPPQKQSTKGVEFSRNKEGDSINDNIKAQ